MRLKRVPLLPRNLFVVWQSATKALPISSNSPWPSNAIPPCLTKIQGKGSDTNTLWQASGCKKQLRISHSPRIAQAYPLGPPPPETACTLNDFVCHTLMLVFVLIIDGCMRKKSTHCHGQAPLHHPTLRLKPLGTTRRQAFGGLDYLAPYQHAPHTNIQHTPNRGPCQQPDSHVGGSTTWSCCNIPNYGLLHMTCHMAPTYAGSTTPAHGGPARKACASHKCFSAAMVWLMQCLHAHLARVAAQACCETNLAAVSAQAFCRTTTFYMAHPALPPQ